MNSIDFKVKYGTLLEKLTLKNWVSVYWNVFYLVRWSLTLLIIVFLRDYYAF